MYGSIERFLGMLLEHHGGQLPAWIAPEQVLVAPVGEAHREHATAVVMVMAAAGLRVRLDAVGARRFVRRAEALLTAGRPSCPFCGQPLDPQGHFCARNGQLN